MKYNKITVSTFLLVVVSLVWFGVSYATTQSGAQMVVSNSAVVQELAAKNYLFKHSPSKGGGMPTVAPKLSKKQKRTQEHAVVNEAVKQTPEIATYFLGKPYRGTAVEDSKLYPIVKKLSLIQLTRTDKGFEYTFKGGAICQEEQYKGSLEMNGNGVVQDSMEMKVVNVAC